MTKLVKRTDPRGLNPEDCCFIFPLRGRPVFRIYHRQEDSFTDYEVAPEVTPFVKLIDDDIELKEYRLDDGSIKYVMDFPEHALSAGKIPLLQPGETWIASD